MNSPNVVHAQMKCNKASIISQFDSGERYRAIFALMLTNYHCLPSLVMILLTFACIFSAESDSSDKDLSPPKRRKGRYVFLEI